MRLRARVDSNHAQIVRELRQAGCSVGDLSRMGQGWPDIAVGRGKQNWFFEIKRPGELLTKDQVVWHFSWLGQVDVIRSTEEALKIIGRKP